MPRTPKGPPTEEERIRRAKRAQEKWMEASRAMARAYLEVNLELIAYDQGEWPEGVTWPVLEGLRDHAELARSMYGKLCERL